MFALIERFFILFREYLLLIVLLIISLFVLSMNDAPAIRKVRAIALGGYAIVHSVINLVNQSVTDNTELVAQKQINAELMLKLSLLRDFQKENEQLKNLLDIKSDYNYPLIHAKIISKLVSKSQGNFILNKGKYSGLEPGMPVVNELGLVGITVDVSEKFSSVRTLHNNNLRISVENRRSGITGILYWDGNKSILRNIPSNYDIKPGDELVTSQFSTIFPPSIPVGKVLGKENTVSGMLSDVEVSLYNSFFNLKHVYVVGIVQDSDINGLKFNLFR